jgi:hypothetical protein
MTTEERASFEDAVKDYNERKAKEPQQLESSEIIEMMSGSLNFTINGRMSGNGWFDWQEKVGPNDVRILYREA